MAGSGQPESYRELYGELTTGDPTGTSQYRQAVYYTIHTSEPIKGPGYGSGHVIEDGDTIFRDPDTPSRFGNHLDDTQRHRYYQLQFPFTRFSEGRVDFRSARGRRNSSTFLLIIRHAMKLCRAVVPQPSSSIFV